MPIATVAPATLVSTFVTSAVGAITYLMLAIATPDTRSVHRGTIGLAAGAGGLIGGYLERGCNHTCPTRQLRAGLGVLAIATALPYLLQAPGQGWEAALDRIGS